MKAVAILISISSIVPLCSAQSPQHIFLTNPTKEPVYLETMDRFDNHQLSILSPSNPKAHWQSTNQPIFLRNAHHQGQAFYLLMPQTAYTITAGPKRYLILTTGSDTLTKITNFHQAYQLANKPSKEVTWEFITEYLAGPAYAKLTFAQRADTLHHRYRSRLEFLQRYAQHYHLDPIQLTPWKDFFFYQYVRGLLYHNPRQIPADSLSRYLTYFQDERKLYLPVYREAATSLLRVIGQQASGKPDFAHMYQQANHFFSVGTRDYLLFHIMKTVSRRKQEKLDNPEFDPVLAQQLLPQFRNDCQTSDYVHYITQAVHLLEMARDSRADHILLINSTGRSSTWTDLLATYRGRIIYVDFWASWCAPCRAELPASHRLRAALSEAKIAFVYISMDEDAKAWSNAVQGVNLSSAANYLLVNSFGSALAKRYQLKTIPRYLLFDQQGRLVTAAAKRPSDPSLLAELRNLAH